MSNFSVAYKTVRANEGGYRNVSWDKGGETYKGIARAFHPSWVGWKIIDQVKKTRTLKTGDVIKDTQLDDMVVNFFEINFWQANKISQVQNASVATLMLDTVINHGQGPKIIARDIVAGATTITSAVIKEINRNPEGCYKKIVESRIRYINGLDLGPDQAGVLSRAVGFRKKFSASQAVQGGVGVLLGLAFFYFMTRNN